MPILYNDHQAGWNDDTGITELWKIRSEVPESNTRAFTGEDLADHYGSQQGSGEPDPTIPVAPATQSAR